MLQGNTQAHARLGAVAGPLQHGLCRLADATSLLPSPSLAPSPVVCDGHVIQACAGVVLQHVLLVLQAAVVLEVHVCRAGVPVRHAGLCQTCALGSVLGVIMGGKFGEGPLSPPAWGCCGGGMRCAPGTRWLRLLRGGELVVDAERSQKRACAASAAPPQPPLKTIQHSTWVHPPPCSTEQPTQSCAVSLEPVHPSTRTVSGRGCCACAP